jgi:outer membrane protein W
VSGAWRRIAALSGGALVAALACAAPAMAQGTGDGFLFRRPRASLHVWVGYAQPRADSPIFAFVTDTFSLSKSSFGAFAIGGDLSVALWPSVDMVYSVGYAGSKANSAYRNWQDTQGLPIQQTTTLERVPLTVGLKWYPVGRGESAGQLAWVPSAWAPFVGVGGGLMWYRFQQYGDFVDYTDSAVVSDAFASHDWTWTGHAFAGVDVSLGARWIVSARAQYTWAQSHLGSDFVGPNQIDLSGLSVTAGLGVRF